MLSSGVGGNNKTKPKTILALFGVLPGDMQASASYPALF